MTHSRDIRHNLRYDDSLNPDWQAWLILINCTLQGIDAGILIQANLYAGNMEGKNKFSKPFVLLFLTLAVNIGSKWDALYC